MTEPTRPCGTCGMPCTPGEYHPYAACLMFKACHNSETVRANLEAVRGTPPAVAGEPVAWEATVPGYIKYVTQSRYERFSNIAKSGYKPFKCSNCATPQAGAVPLTPEQITAAAKKLAECMDYPWDHMPEQGRAEMRKHAQAVLAAANGSPPPPPTA